MVQSLGSFRDLIAHAPQALAALTRTTLIAHHSAASLRAVLQSQNCFSCRHWFGPYLFLPTCVRACWICLFNNRGLWMIPRGVAARAFGLSLRQVGQLQPLRIIPAWYAVGYKHLHQKSPKRVVCVADVKKLAVSIHGTENKVRGVIPQNGRRQFSWRKLNEYQHYRAMPMQPLDADPILMGSPINPTNDEYGGVATVEFASLTSAGVEHGLWCRGCDSVSREGWHHDPNIPSSILPPKVGPTISFMHLAHRSRSPENFLHHIERCYGARHIAEEVGLGQWVQSIRHIPLNHWA